jgi:hypothetical protein
MGLDMYLTKKLYVPKEKRKKIKVDVAWNKDTKQIATITPTYLSEDIAYWRKANHIHKWFVDNVQDGEDDCREYRVEIEQLKALLSKCEEVIVIHESNIKDKESKYHEILPTQEGFFFGGTDYGEYYIADIIETIGMLKIIIQNHRDFMEYDYHSSW